MVRASRALAAVMLLVVCACSGERTGLNPGDKCPDVKGVDAAGTPVSFRQYAGKVTIINFWATWCAPCLNELPSLQALYASMKDRGLTVVGVAVDDSVENIKEAQAKYGLTYPIIIDSESQSKRLYEVKGLPESFVLDAEQRVVVVMDPDGRSGPVTRIIGDREWSEKWASQVLASIGTK